VTTTDIPFDISTDPGRLDVDRVHRWLSTDAYWALGRSRDTVERAIAGSVNYGAYAPDGTQVAYARAVTDLATFGWLCDVYVEPASRRRGLATRLVETVRDQLVGLGVRRLLLATADAHGLYARLGFTPLADPGRWMELRPQAGE
jgi:predicted GNAT family acetyltransferase